MASSLYDVPPPPIAADNPYDPATDARYAGLASDVACSPECSRTSWSGCSLLVRRHRAGPRGGRRQTVLVVAHGNSLRALVKHLDGISDAATLLNPADGAAPSTTSTPTSAPRSAMSFDRAVGDVEAAKAAAEAVANQAKGK
ncbi:MAG: hypothetical protein R2699_07170 [Acidimicrobiales bacterium]